MIDKVGPDKMLIPVNDHDNERSFCGRREMEEEEEEEGFAEGETCAGKARPGKARVFALVLMDGICLLMVGFCLYRRGLGQRLERTSGALLRI
jgi:hypothetical protein